MVGAALRNTLIALLVLLLAALSAPYSALAAAGDPAARSAKRKSPDVKQSRTKSAHKALARKKSRAAAAKQSARSKKRAKASNKVRRRASLASKSKGKRASVDRRKTSRKRSQHARNRRAARTAAIVPARPSIGRAIGLRRVDDPLDLGSSVALVVDSRSGARLYEKNIEAVLPIASITKLMTAMVVIDSKRPMSEMLDISREDVDTERHSRSRLKVGARLSRAEMLQLALMASENRAANALGRHHPGGMTAFIRAMNEKALRIGMTDSNFNEPTGLSVNNVSNASDLAKLVRSAATYPLLRQFSTASDLTVDTGYRQVRFGNTNRLLAAGWDIRVQKTGYISEAGRCLVMQARVKGRPVVMVLLDSDGKYTRFGDARRLRKWLERGGAPGFDTPSAQLDDQASAS